MKKVLNILSACNNINRDTEFMFKLNDSHDY